MGYGGVLRVVAQQLHGSQKGGSRGPKNRDMHLKCYEMANDAGELLLICHFGLKSFSLLFWWILHDSPPGSISNISAIIKLVHSWADRKSTVDSPGGPVLQDDIAAVQVTVKRKAALLQEEQCLQDLSPQALHLAHR